MKDKVCPRCKSDNYWTTWIGFNKNRPNPNEFHCSNCGYVSSVNELIEVEKTGE